MTSKKKSSNESKTMAPVRPPVVVVLGHIDHGKTALLSAIKEIDLGRLEHGGITQHTTAYQIETKDSEGKLRKITFIDTPGHAAFPKMRSRGAKVADIALLVIAADDGVKEQTKEALSHIQVSGIPFIIVINKIDLPAVNSNKVREELLELGVAVEGFGGQVVCCEVSAKEKTNLGELLEMILLTAELEDLRADSLAPPRGVVIESCLDRRCGPLAVVLVKDGTFQIGREIVAGEVSGKIKAMTDSSGGKISEAGPSVPFEVLGLSTVPEVGSLVSRADLTSPPLTSGDESSEVTEDAGSPAEASLTNLKLIIRADTQGTLEAVRASLAALAIGDVTVEVVHSAVGAISDSDVLLAAGVGASVWGFNVKSSLSTKSLARQKGVEIRIYSIIYKLLEDAEKLLQGISVAEAEEAAASGEVIAVFPLPSGDIIAGTKVTSGEFRVKETVVVTRGEEEVHRGRIKVIELERERVRKAVIGKNYGLNIRPAFKFKVGDKIAAAESE